MKFLSCRGDLEVKGGKLYSLEHCVLGAYADDGGMFMPATVPQLTQAKLRDWSKLSFQQLVLEFLSLCIEESEVPRVHLQRIISNAFQAFTQTDGAGKEVINEISFEHLTLRDGARPVAVAELWHGHTLAFKDLPLQVLGGLLGHFLARKKTKINVLVGTSGDTGSAAIEAVRQSPWVNIFVLFPAGGRITQIQELQMTTARSEHNNVHVVACDGTSDDLDVPILECFEKDPDFARKYKLCSINSVNIIRILMQCTHFLYAYLHVCPDADRPVDFSLPTGAAGHIAAGVFTKHMGVPIGQLVAATNDNDLLATFLNTGEFRPRTTGAIQTSSPAIDIQVPYNVERMLYCMSPGTPAEKGLQVRTYLTSLTSPSRGFTLGPEEFQRWREFGLVGRRAGNEDVLRTIRENWKAQDYLLDPHTSVAVHAALSLPSSSLHTHPTIVVFSTAHAAKFLPTVSAATGVDQERLREIFEKSPYANVRRATTLHRLEAKSMPFIKGEDWTAKLRALIVEVNRKQAVAGPQQIPSKL